MALGLMALGGCGRLGYNVVAVPTDGPQPDQSAGRDDARDGGAGADVSPPAEPGPTDAAADGLPRSDGLPPADGPAMDAAPDAPADRLRDDTAADACTSCPASGITLRGMTTTPRRGAEGTGVTVVCPAEQVLIGFEGTHSNNQNYPWLQSLTGLCGIVTLSGSSLNTPATVTAAGKLSPQGSTSGQAWTRACPANQVLVGFEGTAAGWMGEIRFRCAPLRRGVLGSFNLGPVTTLPVVGAPSGSAFPTTDCSTGQVARGADVRATQWLDALGFVCSLPWSSS